MSLCTATECPHIIKYSNVCMYQCSALPCVNTGHISTPESPGSVVSRFGLAVRRSAGKQKGYGSIPLRLSLLFKKVVVCGHCLVTLSFTINETSIWLSSLPILMQESFWWWRCSDSYIISLFPYLRPSLISLVVSVDVKHHERRINALHFLAWRSSSQY